jgi:quercetin dioxygenase-like cupin family protein
MTTSSTGRNCNVATHQFAERSFQPTAFDLGEGRPMPNSHLIYKVTSEETAGRFALLEGTFAPRMLIPPHVHTREDEISIVIHGRLGARVGDVEYELGPGGVLLKPRNIVHSLWNPTDELTVVLEHISPGAYVHFFEDVGALPGGWGNRQAMLEVTARYGESWVETDWLPDVIRRHCLRV